jgi:glycosyltransferase involved in cell wall biosynthesis
MSGVKQGIIIPVYNHGKAAGAVVEKLSSLGIPIIIVDDGSDSETKSYLEKIYSTFPLTVPVVLGKNSGKGRAFYEGLKKAEETGLSHVLQIDADGQHDSGQAAFFLAESADHLEAVICSYPVYDDSALAIRRKGRVIANTWAKIVTLSADIKESMLGFRVYPVVPTLNLYRRSYIDSRMGFDIEILVRLYWKNTPLIFHPVGVSYPADGISHFRLVRDNIRISAVYTRLCCEMLIKWPILLVREIRRKNAIKRNYGN